MKETKFKDTELGEIPEEWSVVTFEEIGVFSKGKGISRSEANSGLIPAIRYGEIYTKHHNYIKEYGSFISHEVAVTSRKLKKGDLLFTASGETKEEIGKSVAFISSEVAYAGGDIIILTPTREIDALYLGYASNVSFVQKQKSTKGQGDAVVHITTNSLKNIKLLVPSLAEQQRIASALFDADALVAELDALIEKKRAIMAGTMQELLTGKRRLQGFSEPWVEKKFCEVGTTYNGLSGKTAADFGHGTSKYVTFVNVIYNAVVNPTILDSVDVSPTERQNAVLKEDLLLNTSSETPEEVGMCSYMATSIPNLYLNSFCFGFRVNNKDVCPLFLSYLLRSATGRSFMLELAQGSTRYNLPKRKFLQSAILLPSSLAEQHAIATILSDMDAEIAELEAKRDKYKEVRQGMMQQLLTGKIRLI